MTKIVFHADNDVNSEAEAVNAAMVKENPELYCFVGDGPYSKEGKGWVAQQKKHFDDKKDKMIWSRGNHDTKSSESMQTQDDMEAWFPEAKALNIGERTWLMSRQVGNTYVISMDTEDLDVEFERDQFNWVKAELVKAKGLRDAGTIDWIIILFHKPFFTLKSSHSPYTAVRFQYKDIFRDAQVDFCVSGHNHNTQLWLPMIPNQSQANGEGEQLFTYAADGKTFDFSKDHGAAFIVSGHSAHEWNPINDSGGGVANVMHFRDSGKFGYTLIETNGKNAHVMSKDVDNAIIFEYKVTREGGTPPPPPPPPPGCLPSECKDQITKQCRIMLPNETINAEGFCIPTTPPPPPPPPPGTVVCPRDYYFNTELQECIPDLYPKKNPVCPDGYTWNKTKKVCMLDAPTPGEPFAKLTAPNQVKGNMVVVLDGSQSVGDTVTITQTSGTNVQLTDAGTNKKQFTAPATGDHKLVFELVAVKSGKEAKTQHTVLVTNLVTPPPSCLQGECKDPTTQQCRVIGPDEELDPATGNCKPKTPTNDGEWKLDQFGIGWLATGEQTLVKQSRDEDTDDRWSENVPGCEKGFEATFIGKGTGIASGGHLAMKQGGSNHSGSGASSQRWLDTGWRADGSLQLEWEGPHPRNHDFDLPDSKCFIRKLRAPLEGRFVGCKWRQDILKDGGSPADGGVRWRMWLDDDPIGADGKPKNDWQLVYDFIDGVDVQVIQPQDYKMTGDMDAEIRRSDTDSHDVYGDGLHVRTLT